MILVSVIGTCPHCGDDLAVFKTNQYKRFVKCLNDECVDSAYPLPRKGSFEVSGEICPKTHLPVLAFVPQTPRAGTKGTYRKKTYFWAKGPCFACFDRSHCAVWQELNEDYNDDN